VISKPTKVVAGKVEQPTHKRVEAENAALTQRWQEQERLWCKAILDLREAQPTPEEPTR